ncbi:D-alanyl-D-alanine carboxypeptidase family protein [Pseudoroseomonas cervicalis]|uniref:D-alanyl-D-alanine carboxypeptidase family protein n=1 Tax=Teichococcus cervicalis TaxID=204525 RepID=UPI00278ABB1E|nr:D-alanyl-D-alanine carboxypeptidase family protein [Pseudoroseomonas cervicalis]MDQ1078562.1 D-alanyl-D-alanine carboxypeptidase [Pseudoroseomonas cervicalis]
MPGIGHIAARAMRRALLPMLALLLLAMGAQPTAAQIGGARYSAIVMDAATGEELISVNAGASRYPASLTKMMTLYMMFEAMQQGRMTLATRIPVSRHAAGQEPSKLGLKPGSSISARDAILALVTKSANDVAAAVAEYIGGSEVQFGRMMTRRAQSLGMRDTSFRNASGLPDANQVTTARDMALLSRALIRHFPQHYAYFNARSFSWRGQTIRGHNRVLDEYDGADGLKTGFIRASGFNLASSAERGGVRLIVVVFGGATSRERDDHVMALLDRGFQERGRGSDMMVAGRAGAPLPAGPRLVGAAQAAAIAPALPRARAVPPPQPRAAARPEPRRAAARAPGSQRGAWAIQVGAFGDQATARSAANRAASRGHHAAAGQGEVERVRVNGRTYWRARVTGLSAASARQACGALRGPCMVISP